MNSAVAVRSTLQDECARPLTADADQQVSFSSGGEPLHRTKRRRRRAAAAPFFLLFSFFNFQCETLSLLRHNSRGVVKLTDKRRRIASARVSVHRPSSHRGFYQRLRVASADERERGRGVAHTSNRLVSEKTPSAPRVQQHHPPPSDSRVFHIAPTLHPLTDCRPSQPSTRVTLT